MIASLQHHQSYPVFHTTAPWTYLNVNVSGHTSQKMCNESVSNKMSATSFKYQINRLSLSLPSTVLTDIVYITMTLWKLMFAVNAVMSFSIIPDGEMKKCKQAPPTSLFLCLSGKQSPYWSAPKPRVSVQPVSWKRFQELKCAKTPQGGGQSVIILEDKWHDVDNEKCDKTFLIIRVSYVTPLTEMDDFLGAQIFTLLILVVSSCQTSILPACLPDQ